MLNKRGGGGFKINEGLGIFVKFNKRGGGGQNKRRGVGILKNPLTLVMNEKRDIYI